MNDQRKINCHGDCGHCREQVCIEDKPEITDEQIPDVRETINKEKQ